MTDAIALLAVSQLICLGALTYLYAEVQRLRRAVRSSAAPAATPVRQLPAPRPAQSGTRAAATPVRQVPVDVSALARRLNRSEDEVRLMLRRQGVVR